MNILRKTHSNLTDHAFIQLFAQQNMLMFLISVKQPGTWQATSTLNVVETFPLSSHSLILCKPFYALINFLFIL